MKIVKCKCSRYIHVYTADNGKCPFCGDMSGGESAADDPFCAPPTALSDKISIIDNLIETGKFKDALYFIDDVLEHAPGPQMKETPQSGEIHWRKLLCAARCKNDFELLCAGKFCDNGAFKNAKKYAGQSELYAYEFIERAEEQIGRSLTDVLTNREREKLRETGAHELVAVYRRKMEEAKRLAQEGISHLENGERVLFEQAFACTAAAEEHKRALGSLLIVSQKLGQIQKDETFQKDESELASYKKEQAMSLQEKTYLESKLNYILETSNSEFAELESLSSSHPTYLEFTRLLRAQKNVVSKINANISIITELKGQTEQVIALADMIKSDYASAREAVSRGDYAPATALLSRPVFLTVVKQSIDAIR